MNSQISEKHRRVFSDNTIFLPQDVREFLQLGPGNYYRFCEKNGDVLIVKVKTEA
jgi:hypothetical protein